MSENGKSERLVEAERIVLEGLTKGEKRRSSLPGTCRHRPHRRSGLWPDPDPPGGGCPRNWRIQRHGAAEYEGLRETYLPEIDFYGKVAHRNSQYALIAAAALRGGVLPDIYADSGWWRAELWQYAFYAVVAYVRTAAEQRGESVEDVARALAVAKEVSVNS